MGHNYFSDNSSLLNVYNYISSSTPHYYTLAAKTQDPSIDASEACFAIYSSETTPHDRLTINADQKGNINFWSFDKPTIYRERLRVQNNGTGKNASFYGTSPYSASVVMASDFYEQTIALGSNFSLWSQYSAKLWVESNNNDPKAHLTASIMGMNTIDKTKDNSSEHIAIEGRCIGLQDDDGHINRGGYFEGGNSETNIGVEAYAEQSVAATLSNIGGDFHAKSALINTAVLGIAEGTSKSNLAVARTKLKVMLLQKNPKWNYLYTF